MGMHGHRARGPKHFARGGLRRRRQRDNNKIHRRQKPARRLEGLQPKIQINKLILSSILQDMPHIFILDQTHPVFRYIRKKGKTLDTIDEEDIEIINSHINSYPRKSLDWKTPIEAMKEKAARFEDMQMDSNVAEGGG